MRNSSNPPSLRPVGLDAAATAVAQQESLQRAIIQSLLAQLKDTQVDAARVQASEEKLRALRVLLEERETEIEGLRAELRYERMNCEELKRQLEAQVPEYHMSWDESDNENENDDAEVEGEGEAGEGLDDEEQGKQQEMSDKGKYNNSW